MNPVDPNPQEGALEMYAHLSSERPVSQFATPADPDASPVLAELTQKMHFFRFLQKEISTAKTEAEKEAVFSILMKTKVQIVALKREWQQIQEPKETVRIDSQQTPALFSAHGMQ
jgi:hypothetical protein